MTKYLRISAYIRMPLPIYDFAPDPFWISFYMRNFLLFFYQFRDRKKMKCEIIVIVYAGGEGATEKI